MAKYPYFRDFHEDVRKVAHEAAEEFKKTAAEADQKADHSIVEKNLKRLGELSLFGLHIPREYGGQGLDIISHVIALEEMAKACVSTAFTCSTHTQALSCINMEGTEEQKRKYLPHLCKDKISAFALTEPMAGSDAASIKTTAR
jgi:alkylation response protein AidB-like acyl-CoA dehydrogenase